MRKSCHAGLSIYELLPLEVACTQVAGSHRLVPWLMRWMRPCHKTIRPATPSPVGHTTKCCSDTTWSMIRNGGCGTAKSAHLFKRSCVSVPRAHTA
eukprot:820303-Amphidinium_carterae.1